MKNSLRIHKWTHNEFNIFILGVLTRPPVIYNIIKYQTKMKKKYLENREQPTHKKM